MFQLEVSLLSAFSYAYRVVPAVVAVGVCTLYRYSFFYACQQDTNFFFLLNQFHIFDNALTFSTEKKPLFMSQIHTPTQPISDLRAFRGQRQRFIQVHIEGIRGD